MKDKLSTRKKYESTNYSQFTRLKGNRPLPTEGEARFTKTLASMKEFGFLPSRPIIVSSNGEIIDGQGRLLVSAYLGIPFFYEVEEGDPVALMLAINLSQKNWSIDNWIGSYVESGNIFYIRLQEFAKRHKFSASTALIIYAEDGGKVMDRLKKGKELPLYVDSERVAEFVNKTKEFVPFSKTKEYLRALKVVFAKASEKHIKRLEKKAYAIVQQATMFNYLAEFENVINKGLGESERISLIVR